MFLYTRIRIRIFVGNHPLLTLFALGFVSVFVALSIRSWQQPNPALSLPMTTVVDIADNGDARIVGSYLTQSESLVPDQSLRPAQSAVARARIDLRITLPESGWGIGITTLRIDLRAIERLTDSETAESAVGKSRASIAALIHATGEEFGVHPSEGPPNTWTGSKFGVDWMLVFQRVYDAGLYALPAGVFPVIALASWRKLFSRKKRRKDPCPKCGYDRTGLPPSGRCPECGRPRI